MSRPDDPRRNDEYAWIDEAAPKLLAAARDLIERGEARRVSDEAVAQIMNAAIRLYVAKSDGEERTFPADRRPQRRGADRDRAPLRGLRAVARAAARADGACAMVSPPPGRRH